MSELCLHSSFHYRWIRCPVFGSRVHPVFDCRLRWRIPWLPLCTLLPLQEILIPGAAWPSSLHCCFHELRLRIRLPNIAVEHSRLKRRSIAMQRWLAGSTMKPVLRTSPQCLETTYCLCFPKPLIHFCPSFSSKPWLRFWFQTNCSSGEFVISRTLDFFFSKMLEWLVKAGYTVFN